jgi:excisionase family DNA binding protein
MEEFLTTRQVLELLKVDRITIYRMLRDGRLKGNKIGQQWRFARRDVDRLVNGGSMPDEPLQVDPNPSFPTHCVQTIQDLFSDVSQIGALVVDANGAALTQVSQPCGFCQLMLRSAAGAEACRASWKSMAQHAAAGSKFFTCHAGLQYVAAPILDEKETVGYFLAGEFYWQAADPREETERVRRLCAANEIERETLQQAAAGLQVIDPQQHARVENFPTTAARAVQSILHERIGFVERLQQIASLTQIH